MTPSGDADDIKVTMSVACSDCKGSGAVEGEPCSKCGGTGKHEATTTLTGLEQAAKRLGERRSR